MKCRYCKQEIEEEDVVIDGMHEMCFLHVDEVAEGEKDGVRKILEEYYNKGVI